VAVWGRAPRLKLVAAAGSPRERQERSVVFDGRELPATVLRGALPPGMTLRGPAVCALQDATALVPPGWSGTVDDTGGLALRRDA
jgi:N-methylhydantoinase A/oxoprolinase/acetone carboxylase beta subunit